MFDIHFVYYLGTSELPSLFHSHYYRLCKGVSCQHDVITPLADVLYGSGLITNEIRLAVQHTLGLSPYERATKLLNPAVEIAQSSIELACKFCDCRQECEIPVPEDILTGKSDMSMSANILNTFKVTSIVKFL